MANHEPTSDRSPIFEDPPERTGDIVLKTFGALETEADIIMAWTAYTTAKAAMKRHADALEQAIIDHCKTENVKEINIGGGEDGKRWRLRVTKKKTERWDAKAVMDMFSIPEQVQAIFSSPKFKKGELTIALGDRKAVDDFITVTWSDDLEVKEIDTDAVKRFARKA